VSAASSSGRHIPGCLEPLLAEWRSQCRLHHGHSVDLFGYNHICYKYQTGTTVVEAPTLRLNPGDTCHCTSPTTSQALAVRAAAMHMSASLDTNCGDTGAPTVNSTNVHFHGLNIPPICGHDDVLNTLIQPGTPGFQYAVQIPATEPPGWSGRNIRHWRCSWEGRYPALCRGFGLRPVAASGKL
jgi:FtsP/CotA-like multicopper oxidase with cupredoxin domain